MTTGRESTQAARLARLGFIRTAESAAVLEQWPALETRLEYFRDVADRDQALLSMGNLIATGAVDIASWDDDNWLRIVSVLGASQALADHVIRNPTHASYIASAETLPAPEAMRSDLLSAVSGKSWDQALDALRIEYRRQVCAIAGFDLSSRAASTQMMPAVASSLTVLADAVVAAALQLAREQHEDSSQCELAVIAMGKCGASELNYVSDVDVMFVARSVDGRDDFAALAIATELAKSVMRACSAVTAQGTIWEVDAALRPEGKAGALVRTLDSYVDYYQRWAKTWEFQALLKSRHMAGSTELGAAFVDAMSAFVWQAADHPGFVSDVQAMRERVTDLIPAKDADRELKLGRGGLRDVEFAVQLLQLVHGRSDVMVRSPNTLIALEQLATWGYVGREDAATLASAYRFLRTLEHRIQVSRMRRTHVLPEDSDEQRALGRSMGYLMDPIDDLNREWRKYSAEVRRIHEKLFYRPLLQAVARLDSNDARLTPADARLRLAALGYADPENALRHLESLTSGVTRRAAIQRTLLPVMLGWFAQAPDPDAGLLGFRRISEALGATPWYLGLLRDESITAERLATILASSRYATDLLLRSPDSVRMLSSSEELQPRTRDELLNEARATASRYDTSIEAVAALRAMRRRELFRISSADVLGLLSAQQVGDALTDVTDAVLTGALDSITARMEEPPPFAVVAMGRYGGGEMGYSSDADVMFVYDDSNRDEALAHTKAHAIANELRTILMAPSTDPELIIDADLRPEGKNGPLVRSLGSFAQYYERWSSGWEVQALLRAEISAGDSALGHVFTDLINPLRYNEHGLPEAQLREIRRLKARMESERLPRGIDPTLHTKLGPGGLSDVEWVAQVFQLQHGHDVPALRTTRTLLALDAATEAGLLAQADQEVLAEAWTLVTRVRNATALVRGRAADVLPVDLVELSRVAYALGFGLRGGQHLTDDYRRMTRRARTVVMRVFYGE